MRTCPKPAADLSDKVNWNFRTRCKIHYFGFDIFETIN